VQNETAKNLCEIFYRCLVEQASGIRDYRQAFLAATDALRKFAHTGGAKNGASSSSRMQNGGASSSRFTRSIDKEQEDVAETSSGGRKPIWHQEDVVLFLSQDGDIEPIYLWRERLAVPRAPVVEEHYSAPVVEELAAAAESVDAGLTALFKQYGLSSLCSDVCRELGVVEVGDLSDIDKEMLDGLPNYLKDQLKPLVKKRLYAMIASHAIMASSSGGSKQK